MIRLCPNRPQWVRNTGWWLPLGLGLGLCFSKENTLWGGGASPSEIPANPHGMPSPRKDRAMFGERQERSQ